MPARRWNSWKKSSRPATSAMRSSVLFVKADAALLNATAKAALMRITLTDAGKRFNRDWIFRHLDHEFSPGHSYAITGSNGSGKSTLLQAIAGAIDLSEGRIGYETTIPPPAAGASNLAPDHVYRH